MGIISAEMSTPVMPISFKTVQRLLKRHQHLAAQLQNGELTGK